MELLVAIGVKRVSADLRDSAHDGWVNEIVVGGLAPFGNRA